MRTALSLLVGAALLSPGVATAQDGSSIDIGDIGSSRIGGPGLTKEEKRAVAAMDEPPEYLTEETLPPPGHKKRLPGLHVLAKRYVESQAYKDACEKYDLILEESGEEGVLADELGKRYAGKSFLECAKIAFGVQEFEKAEKLLQKSERFVKSGPRHQAVRRKIMRENYRKKVSDGDIGGAVEIFNRYQAQKEDEDERIWFGEQLATKAWAAHEAKDEITRDEMMAHLETISPMNTEYRRLKDEIESGETILQNALMFAGAAVGLVLVLGWFTKWRAKAKLGASGKKNKFDLDDDL